jgi:hypothetical protein
MSISLEPVRSLIIMAILLEVGLIEHLLERFAALSGYAAYAVVCATVSLVIDLPISRADRDEAATLPSQSRKRLLVRVLLFFFQHKPAAANFSVHQASWLRRCGEVNCRSVRNSPEKENPRAS